MRWLDLTLPTIEANLALDEALVVVAEQGTGSEVLRVWSNPVFAVVVGAGGSVSIDVNEPACAADGVPIRRRSSGGGTVLIGPGCLCFSLVLEYDRAAGLSDIPASNRYVLNRVLRALQPVLAANLEGTSDLARDGIKFSGNAQHRKRTHFLHHGTLLCGFALPLIAKYLNPPERQPEYRRNRPHGDFVMNLPTTVEEAKLLLSTEWEAKNTDEPVPYGLVEELVREKYSLDDWNRRR